MFFVVRLLNRAAALGFINGLLHRASNTVGIHNHPAMLVPGGGKELQSLDFAGVESRGTAWLFDEEWALQAFRAFDAGLGPDSYKLAYARAFRMRPDEVDKPQRQVGKVLDLSMGYEGGANAFATMAANYGVYLVEMAAQVRQALLRAYEQGPTHVRDAAQRACVGLAVARYTASRMVSTGEFSPSKKRPSSSPTVPSTATSR